LTCSLSIVSPISFAISGSCKEDPYWARRISLLVCDQRARLTVGFVRSSTYPLGMKDNLNEKSTTDVEPTATTVAQDEKIHYNELPYNTLGKQYLHEILSYSTITQPRVR